MGDVSYRVHYAALANPICRMGAMRRAETEPECGPIGGCGINSANGQTEMLPQRAQHPPLEFETEAQLSQ
jgi:hypothetical protein